MLRCDPKRHKTPNATTVLMRQRDAPGGGLHDDGFETALKKVSRSLMAPIKPDGVADAQPLHAGGEVGIARLHQQMKMIFHEHIGMQTPAEAFDGFAEQLAEMLVIALVAANRLPLVAAGGEVVPTAGLFDSQRARHDRCLRETARPSQLYNVKM